MTSNAVAIARYIEAPLHERHEYAQALASAGDLIPKSLFGPPTPAQDGQPARPPAPSPGKVLLVLETGAMLGLHPVAALSGINIIEGKPAASAGLMSAVIRGAGHKLHVTVSGSIEGGDYKATTTLIRHDDPEHPFVSVWTPQRAARAGLGSYSKGDDDVWKFRARSSGGKELPWELYTESLCKARGTSETARDGAQDVLFGVRYTPEELGAEVDAQGEVVALPEHQEQQEAAPKTALPPAAKRAAKGTQGTKRPAAKPEPTEPPEEEQGPGEIVVEPEPDDEPTAPASSPVADQEGIHVDGETTPWPEGSPLADQSDGIDYANRIELAEAARAALDLDDEEAVKKYNATHGKITGHFATSHAEMARTDARMRGEDARGPAEDAAAAVAATEGPKPKAAPAAEPEEPQEAADTVLPGSVDFHADLLAATDLTQLRAVWDAATATAGAMTSELRAAVTKRKVQMQAWLAETTDETLDAYVARVEEESRQAAEAAGS